MVEEYEQFIRDKAQLGTFDGFEPIEIPDFLFPFQKALVEWAIQKGKAAIFASCGLGKTPMQLVWADNIARKTNKPVLIMAPLAVSFQTVREAQKFGIDCRQSRDGTVHPHITVTNYERLHYFNPQDFAGAVCDESAVLKSFDAARRDAIIEFMRMMPYRLLCSATPAPNDYVELGNSSEALGNLGHIDMLTMFFRNNNHTIDRGRGYRGKSVSVRTREVFEGSQWRFKGHAEMPFWRWVCSWARAVRRPSDLGFDDTDFILPPLIHKKHVIEAETLADGMLVPLAAVGLHEQRAERKRTVKERCEKVAELVSGTGEQALVWCHLNPEGDLLSKIIPDAKQISGSQREEQKEQTFLDFINGDLRVCVTKPSIGAWGLNLQNCSHTTYFPSHSYEQFYQGIRRMWRFGQKNAVTVETVMTEGDADVMANLERKSKAADHMFSNLVSCMNETLEIGRTSYGDTKAEIPSWL